MKTRFFSNSIGVFEGGGVRAAAFAGAFEAATQLGMGFSAVAGTSAGSIVAALIAAGATPEFVIRKLSETNFADLLAAPNRHERPYAKAPLIAWAGRAIPGDVRALAKVAQFAGLYSSAMIETWIEGLLNELLVSRNSELRGRRVTFKDLLYLPLFVLSADVNGAKGKLWSQKETPDESVAFAVRCSCAIPLFFQPVSGSGGAVFVDGGTVSSLPSYIFAESEGSGARFSERVVGFRLRSSHPRGAFSDFRAFATALADSLTSAGTDVQLTLQSNVYGDRSTIALSRSEQARLLDHRLFRLATGRAARRLGRARAPILR